MPKHKDTVAWHNITRCSLSKYFPFQNIKNQQCCVFTCTKYIYDYETQVVFFANSNRMPLDRCTQACANTTYEKIFYFSFRLLIIP